MTTSDTRDGDENGEDESAARKRLFLHHLTAESGACETHQPRPKGNGGRSWGKTDGLDGGP